MGRGNAEIACGASIRGSYQDGVFWYEATRPDGYRERFLFRWQATAYVNGWTPPETSHRYCLPRVQNKIEGGAATP